MDNRGYPGNSPYPEDPYGNGPDYGGDYPDYPDYGGDYGRRGYGDQGYDKGYDQGYAQGGYAEGGYDGSYADGYDDGRGGGYNGSYDQGYDSDYGDDRAAYPASDGKSGAGGNGGGKGGSSMMMTVGLVTVGIVVLLLGAIGIGMWLSGGDDAETRADADRERQPRTTTEVIAEEEEERSPDSPTTTVTTVTEAAEEEDDDFGTGRSDVDSRGWTGSYARCSSGDDVLAVLEVLDNSGNPMQTVACETSGGRMYYRGTGTAGDLEAPITDDYGNRIIARNGDWEYEMTPSALNIYHSSGDMSFPSTSWGRA